MKIRLISPLTLGIAAVIGGVASGVGTYVVEARGMVARAEGARNKLLAAQRLRQQQQAQGWDFWTIEIDNLTSELKEEKARLAKRSDDLDQREAHLAIEEQELGKVRADIESMHQQMEQRITTISADESKNLRTLAQTYTNLTPRAVVAIFRQMDDATAVKILSLMKPDVVGPIFEEMADGASSDPSMAHRAAVLSDKLRLLRTAPTPSS
jgi:flagellar motility protein MotE (MotC chaperone)